MPSIPPSAYQVTTPNRTPRPSTTQQPSYYKPTTPFRAAPPPPPSVTTQPVSYYKPTTPIKLTPPPSGSSLARAAKFLSKVPKGGGAALAIAFELFFPPPAGDNYYDRNPTGPPPRYLLHPPEPSQFVELPSYPFRGGQGVGIPYKVYFYTYFAGGKSSLQNINVYGPVVGLIEVITGPDPARNNYTSKAIFIRARDISGKEKDYQITGADGGVPATVLSLRAEIVDIVRGSGQPDTSGDPPPLNNPSSSAPGNSLGAPIAAPPSVAPSPAPKAPPSVAPSPSPGITPGVSPGETPQPKRYPGPIPSPSPVPGSTPQPQKYPDLTPAPDFYPVPIGDPGPLPGPGVGSPNPNPTPAPANVPFKEFPAQPNKSPVPVQLPINTPTIPHAPLTPGMPLTTDPNPGRRDPSFIPQPFRSNPSTGNPEPKAPPLVTPNRSPDPPKDPNDDLGDKIRLGTGIITTILAGITALVQPGALQSAANAGTCQAFAPGGCAAPVGNNAAAAAANSANNGTALASIMAFLQALQTLFLIPIRAGVELINTKLGPVMSGLNGIGGFLARTAEAAKIDKVLNAMNTVLLLHNAAMLSRNLGSTLGDLTSQALATIGIKDGDSPIDVNEILGKQTNNFMSSILGAEVWAGTKTSWNKASSIIASATNLMYTVRSMFDSTREILEWTAENTGKIGNALKRFRIVG